VWTHIWYATWRNTCLMERRSVIYFRSWKAFRVLHEKRTNNIAYSHARNNTFVYIKVCAQCDQRRSHKIHQRQELFAKSSGCNCTHSMELLSFTHIRVFSLTHTHMAKSLLQTACQGDVTSSWALKSDSLKRFDTRNLEINTLEIIFHTIEWYKEFIMIIFVQSLRIYKRLYNCI
jgi:hypothetical protein